MEEIDFEEIKEKTKKNIIFLSFRNIGIQAVSALGFFILTILLGTGEVGLFAIVSESVGILGYFSDVGLASALIQQKTEVTKEELRTTFLIQQILVLLSLFIVFLIYPRISLVKNYGLKEMWIVISLCFAFLAASLKTIPSVLLERKLNFKLISTIDIIENLVFYLFAVIFAFLGFGVFSYVIATFCRSIFGLIVMYRYSPWPFGFSFSLESVKKLFKYGIPFQFNSFIAMAKDRLSNLLVAGIIGRDFFGILSWAQKGPRIPLSFMDAIMRVTFPTFSRLQDHPELLKRSLKRSIYFIALFVFPSVAGISLIAPDVINFIPKYTKWAPAIVPLYLYAINAGVAAVTTPVTNAFNAVGKITTTTKLMIMWTVLTWIFYPLLSIKFGYLGTAVATLIVGLSSVVVWVLSEKIFSVSILKTIFKPLVGTFLMIFVLLFLPFLHLYLPFQIIAKVVFGIAVYFAYHFFFSKPELIWFIDHIKSLKK